jgi:hypothetical protein
MSLSPSKLWDFLAMSAALPDNPRADPERIRAIPAPQVGSAAFQSVLSTHVSQDR